MLNRTELQNRLQFIYHTDSFRRTLGNTEVVIHCHHYNARIQEVIEGSRQIDGKQILLTTAEAVFANCLAHLLKPQDDRVDKCQLAEALYAQLGYGTLDLSHLDEGLVTASASHFVEGWNAGFQERTEPVCTFTEGYLQGVIYAITGKLVYVREQACMIADEPLCRFAIDFQRQEPLAHYPKHCITQIPVQSTMPMITTHFDTQEVSNRLFTLPLYGNKRGVIPMFGVYLAHVPADFLNLVTLRFIEEMNKKQLFRAARQVMIDIAEHCGINTFNGFLNSPEWKQLFAPKVKNAQDKLFAIIAVSNVLGWGNWQVIEHTPAESLILQSFNGYEGFGIKEYGYSATTPHCFMLTGVSAGIMSLIYGEGSLKERFGRYVAEETQCIACGDSTCRFEVSKIY